LAVPFRVNIFLDWFTVFKSKRNDVEMDVYPLHLYTFGDGLEIEEDDRRRMAENIEDGFGATDGDSALAAIGDLFEMRRIALEFEFPPSNDLDDMGRRELLEFHAFLSENADEYGLYKKWQT
jgi:hypothetical protein